MMTVKIRKDSVRIFESSVRSLGCTLLDCGKASGVEDGGCQVRRCDRRRSHISADCAKRWNVRCLSIKHYLRRYSCMNEVRRIGWM